MWFIKHPFSVPMNRVLICLVLVWTGTQYQAQGTFNIRHYLNSATDFNTVYETDSGYIVVGSGWDTIPTSHLEMKLFRFDHTGELLDEIDIGGPDQDLWMYPSFGSDSALDDTFITQGSGGTHTDSSVGAFLTVFNAHLDTLLSVNVVSPYLNQPELGSNWISSYYSHIAEDSCIFMECQIFSEENGNDCMIKKFDKSGNWLWDYFCPAAGENNIEIVRCIRSDFNGGCYLLWRSSYKDEGGNNNYNLNRSSVIHLNDEGEELEQWYSPNDDLLPASWIDFVVDHYNFVLAGCISEYPNEDPFHSQATVTKIDMEGNLEWFSRAGDYSEDVYRIFQNITQTTDSNYVASGIYIDYNVADSLLDGERDFNGWLVKFDRYTGDVLWERYYHYVQSPNDEHEINDLKATRDGGVIFSGEATNLWVNGNPNLELPIQQGWLVKVDECGCLVPGCDAFCSYTDTTSLPIPDYFIFGPNPVVQFLNIFVGELENDHPLRFLLYDLSGRIVKEFVFSQGNTTYMWDLENLARGEYVLALEQDDRRLQTEVILKQ